MHIRTSKVYDDASMMKTIYFRVKYEKANHQKTGNRECILKGFASEKVKTVHYKWSCQLFSFDLLIDYISTCFSLKQMKSSTHYANRRLRQSLNLMYIRGIQASVSMCQLSQ